MRSSFLKNEGTAKEFSSKRVVLTTPFIQEKSVTQRGDMLHTIDGPMQLMHADVAGLHFFIKLTVALKYCLVCVDPFTSKTYTYGMKKKPTILQVRKILLQH